MKNRVVECTLCHLWEGAKTVCMKPYDPGKTTWAVVGEAPGAEEDRQGRPFVGPAGQYLASVLAKYGLDLENAFITNTVKCRPPNNRTPKQGEINKCIDYLRADLDGMLACGVRYILALGGVAYRALNGDGSILEHAGQWYRVGPFWVLPATHPANVLRNPKYTDMFEESIERFAYVVKNNKTPVSEYREPEIIVADTKELLKRMEKELCGAPEIAFDVETTGLDEYDRDAELVCVSLCAEPGRVWFVPDRREAFPHLWRVFQSCSSFVAHNGRYDRRWLLVHAGCAPVLKKDTMIMSYLLDEESPRGLEAVAARYLDVPSWKSLVNFKTISKNNITKDLIVYNSIDVDVTLRLSRVLWDKLTVEQKRLHNFLLAVSEVLEDVEMVGVFLDREKLLDLERKYEDEMRVATETVAEITGRDPEDCKLGSSVWLRNLLFEELSQPIIDMTNTEQASTSEYSLKQLLLHGSQPEIVNAVLSYRRAQKYLGSYVRPWLSATGGASRAPTRRLRCTYNLCGTVTGRLSCRTVSGVGMSLHQIPRESEIRSVVSAPPGKVLLSADYSQIELRMAAAIAHEERMLEAYRKGEDLHRLTAHFVLGKPLEEVTREDRQKAKAINFGFLYGMSAAKFKRYAFSEYGLEFGLDEAEKVRAKYFNLYPGLVKYHENVERQVKDVGRVKSVFGRVRHLSDVNSDNPAVAGEAIRQGINFLIQSVASDLTLAAMVLIGRTKGNFMIVGQVHDSILIECDEDIAEKVARVVGEIMTSNVPKWVRDNFGWVCPVPLAVEIGIGQNWGDYKKVLDMSGQAL